MFSFIEFLRKRPTDRTILGGRIVFGLVIALLLGLDFAYFSLNLPAGLAGYETGIKYALFLLAIVPVLMGATNICMAKRKYVRMIQIAFGFALIFIGNFLIASPEVPRVTTGASLDYQNIEKNETRHGFNLGFYMALLGILPLLAGITGKCITSKCMKYGEVIKKIRV